MQAGARFLRFRRKKNHQKINQKSMQNKSEKMIGKFQQKYQFWDGFGKGFGRVWEGLEGIKIRWKKSFEKGGRGTQVPISTLGRNLYRGGLPWISPPLSRESILTSLVELEVLSRISVFSCDFNVLVFSGGSWELIGRSWAFLGRS